MQFDFVNRLKNKNFASGMVGWLHQVFPNLSHEEKLPDFCSKHFAETLAAERSTQKQGA